MPTDELSNDDAIFEDVRAAYAEASGRAPATDDTPAPVARDTVTETSATGKDGTDETKQGARALPPRGERGKFAKRDADGKEKPETAKDDKPGTETAGDDTADTEGEDNPQAAKTAGGPPPSWTVKSKAAWDQLPDAVKADIAKRETEVAQGLSALRDYKDLKPYAEMAAKHNTTISAALKHYTGLENVLRKDLGAGLAQIVQNYGMNQQQAAQFFGTLAQRFGGGQTSVQPTPSGQPQPADPLQNLLKPFLDPLQNEVKTLREKLSSREVADRNASEQSLTKAISSFSVRPENRYFADLEETITRLFETGMVPLTGNHEGDLRTAYDTAAQMVPEVREALIDQRLREQVEAERKKEQEAANRARNASRSITGSRVPGTVVRPAVEANGHDDIEADVRAAYRMHAQY
jgi:hypothetical protein